MDSGVTLPDPDDVVFYEVALSKESTYLITGNTKHFPKCPIFVTPAEMMSIWERLVYVPWTDFIEKENARRRLLSLLARQRERVANGETQEMTMDEIDAEIALARTERRAKEAKPCRSTC